MEKLETQISNIVAAFEIGQCVRVCMCVRRSYIANTSHMIFDVDPHHFRAHYIHHHHHQHQKVNF